MLKCIYSAYILSTATNCWKKNVSKLAKGLLSKYNTWVEYVRKRIIWTFLLGSIYLACWHFFGILKRHICKPKKREKIKFCRLSWTGINSNLYHLSNLAENQSLHIICQVNVIPYAISQYEMAFFKSAWTILKILPWLSRSWNRQN